MSYGIIRIQKMTKGLVKSIQIHDQREKDHSNTNMDIDFKKSYLNYDLHNTNKINFTQAVKTRVEKLNLKKAVRKDAIVMCQCLITSDKEFFKNMSAEEVKKFFKDSYSFVCKKYGAENIISATVHLDETTPHLHVNFVPVTNDNRLCAKDLFTRKNLTLLQDEFFEHNKSCGYNLLRGESREEKRKHMSTEKYKIQTLQDSVNELKQKNKTLLQENKNLIQENINLKHVNEDLKKAKENFNTEFKAIQSVTAQISKIKHNLDVGYKNTISNLKIVSSPKLDVNKMNIKKSLIGKKIILDKDDFDSMVDVIEFCNANKHKIDNFDNLLENYKGIEKDLRVNVKEKMQSFQKEEKIKQLESDLAFKDKINNFLFEQIKIHNLENEVKKAIEEKFKNQNVQKIDGMEL